MLPVRSQETGLSPMFAHHHHSGFAPSKPMAKRGFTLIELMVVVAVVALVCAALMPAVCSAHRKSARIQCINYCKLIGLALHNYQQAYDSLPPAYTVDANGRPLHSWRTLILPYLEQEKLYQSIDLAKPWDDPANAAALATAVPAYHCPSAPGPSTLCSYLGVATPGGCFPPGEPRKLEEITDGPSSTLMVIEAGSEYAAPWMAPVDADERLILGLGPTAKLNHAGGVNAGMADGSVRFLKDSVPAEVRSAMISVAGGEKRSNDPY
ncbi:DUF1559 domain-containing protein [Tundrisphaera sp. TA3]|uniref:DUF1559 family PulG-like putative transporter n=1 Tax=Tundrisphaera sp. TA3 TaxID=3435775 RepID=UPI003EBD1D4A